jgi:DNA-binding IclR family transcriptional regulator
VEDNVKVSGSIQVIARAATILRVLAETPDGLSLGAIAKRVQLPRSTVQRIVGALQAEQLVEIDHFRGGTRLGTGVQKLVTNWERGLIDAVRPQMSLLCAATGETVVLTETVPPESRFVFEVRPDREIYVPHDHAAMQRLHSSAHGKVSLARINEVALNDVIGRARLLKITGNTITEFAALLSELELVRRFEVAFDREEHGKGRSAISTCLPIGGRSYELTVLAPTSRFESNWRRIEAKLMTCRHSISDERGV